VRPLIRLGLAESPCSFVPLFFDILYFGCFSSITVIAFPSSIFCIFFRHCLPGPIDTRTLCLLFCKEHLRLSSLYPFSPSSLFYPGILTTVFEAFSFSALRWSPALAATRVPHTVPSFISCVITLSFFTRVCVVSFYLLRCSILVSPWFMYR